MSAMALIDSAENGCLSLGRETEGGGGKGVSALLLVSIFKAFPMYFANLRLLGILLMS